MPTRDLFAVAKLLVPFFDNTCFFTAYLIAITENVNFWLSDIQSLIIIAK